MVNPTKTHANPNEVKVRTGLVKINTMAPLTLSLRTARVSPGPLGLMEVSQAFGQSIGSVSGSLLGSRIHV